jgi:hypothetical protein
MVGAKQLKTQDLSWFRPRAVRPTVVCSRHYIALHRSACSGAATSEAGEEAWPPSPWRSDRNEFRCCGRIGESACVVILDVRTFMSPCGEGVHLPFIGQGEGELQACRTIQLHEEVWPVPPRSWRPPWRSLPRSSHHGASCTRTVAASRVGA